MKLPKSFFVVFCILFLIINNTYHIYSFTDIEKGDSLYKKGEYQKALQQYRELLEESKSYPYLNQKIGLCYFYLEEYEQCLVFLNKKTKYIIGDYIDYFSLLCYREVRDSNITLAKIKSFKNKHKSSLLKNYVELIEAEILKELGNYNDSNKILIRLSKKIKHKEKRQEILRYIAENYIDLKIYDSALFYLKKIIDDYPFEPVAVDALDKIISVRKTQGKIINDDEILLGISLYIKQRKYSESYEFYKKYEKNIDRKIAERDFELGRIQYYLGNYDQALKIFKNTIKKYPRSNLLPEARLLIARSLWRKSEYEKSIKEYLTFTKLHPKNKMVPEVFWKIAWIYEGEKEYDKAVLYYGKITRRKNEFKDMAVFRKGFCYFKADKYREALNVFNILIMRKNVNHRLQDTAIYWKALTLEKLGDTAQSNRFLKMLAEMKVPTYYSFKAEERLGSNSTLSMVSQENSAEQNISNKDYEKYQELKKGVIVGKLFGKSFGREIIDNARKRRKNSSAFLKCILTAYEEIEAYSKAIRVSIALKGRYVNGKTPEEFVSIMKKVYPLYFSEEVKHVLKENKINPFVVLSIMRRESAFEYDVISRAGAVGLLQLLPENGRKTAKKLGIPFEWSDLNDPEKNILLGYTHFESILKRYKGNYAVAFAAYNAGEYNVNEWVKKYGLSDMDIFIDSIEYIETRNYVKAVFEAWWLYEKLWGKIE